MIPIAAAAGAFVHWRITLPMSIGALAVNLSTVIVAVNAQFYVISNFNITDNGTATQLGAH